VGFWCGASLWALRANWSVGPATELRRLMIAAYALAAGLILITHDAAFSFVDGLKTEDWTAG